MAQEAGTSWIDLVAPIAAVLGLLVAVFGIVQPIRASFLQARITQLESRLNNFCAPFYHLRRRSERLWDKLKMGNVASKDERFNLLELLLSGKTFSDNDQALIAEIVNIGSECEKLILNHAGLLEGKELRNEVLPEAANHFKMMKLIHDRKVTGEIDRFKDMKFKNVILDNAIEKLVNEVEQELKDLKEQLSFKGWIKRALK